MNTQLIETYFIFLSVMDTFVYSNDQQKFLFYCLFIHDKLFKRTNEKVQEIINNLYQYF